MLGFEPRRRHEASVDFRNRCDQPLCHMSKGLVLQGRIELPSSSLPMTRSTTELLQQIKLRSPGLYPGCHSNRHLQAPLSRGGSGRHAPWPGDLRQRRARGCKPDRVRRGNRRSCLCDMPIWANSGSRANHGPTRRYYGRIRHWVMIIE